MPCCRASAQVIRPLLSVSYRLKGSSSPCVSDSDDVSGVGEVVTSVLGAGVVVISNSAAYTIANDEQDSSTVLAVSASLGPIVKPYRLLTATTRFTNQHLFISG